ncbi:MAG: ATP-binding protein [Candidatus Micrarchaeota archaeon]
MYFETEPKSKKEDFFNYAFEYEQVKKAILRRDKIIAIIGVRRVGKTSLLNIIYNETKNLKIWLDGRIVSDPKKEIFAAIYETVKSGKPKIFGKIESLNVSAFGVGLGVKLGAESQNEIEKKIAHAGPICVFIDEAQRMERKALADVLSYCYDRFPQISFVISGSEIGLVEDILGEDDSEHSLYGRNIVKINMERLDKNRSMEFLRKGFEQIDVKIRDEEIEGAITELDGLAGWLTLYGYERGIMKNKNALEKTAETAARIAASELLHFLKKTRNRKLYLAILRNAKGTSWNELRNTTGRELGARLNPNLFTFALTKLMTYSFIEKRDDKYYLSDPLLFKATFLL